MIIDVKILDKRLVNNLPTYGTPGSAGLDLRACINEPLTLVPGEVQLISSGLSIFVKDPQYAAIILPRSGMGHKNGIILGNTLGLIDSDYQGDMKISLWNRSDKPFTIEPLERVAQLIIVPVLQVQFNVVQEFEATKRGEGGFNSTGTK